VQCVGHSLALPHETVAGGWQAFRWDDDSLVLFHCGSAACLFCAELGLFPLLWEGCCECMDGTVRVVHGTEAEWRLGAQLAQNKCSYSSNDYPCFWEGCCVALGTLFGELCALGRGGVEAWSPVGSGQA
jgi:hypothetical protein